MNLIRRKKWVAAVLAIVICFSLIVIPVSADDEEEVKTVIKASPEEITMKVGETTTIAADVSPESDDSELLWNSSNSSIAAVDQKGNVTGVAAGTAEILIRLKSQEEVETSVKVAVQEEPVEEETDKVVPLQDFSVEENNIIMKAKDTLALTVKYTPVDATERPTWSSSDDSVIEVNEDGKIIATGVGNATVTATWKKKTVTIAVKTLFSDVEENAYYYAPVYWALENGFTSGMTATDFKPESTCTRGQIMTFLWRINGSPEPDEKNNPFKDVTSDWYYFKPVLWAYQSGLTAGTSATTFSPDAYCSRGQVVQFIWGCQKNKETRTVAFRDVSNTAYYYHAVKWAYHNGVTAGTSKTTFGPNEPCTRGQIMTFLYKCKDNKADIYNKDKAALFDDAAAKVLDQVGWDLRAAFNWSAGLEYYGHNSQMPSNESPGVQWFSDYGFKYHKGNCYVMACTFYRMAKMLGYEVYPISGWVPSSKGGMTPHSWTEIVENGKIYVYDPNFTNETGRNGYRITYGQSGTWQYANYHRMTK